MKVIALEEHYLDPELARHFKDGGPEARDAALLERIPAGRVERSGHVRNPVRHDRSSDYTQ